MAKQKSCKNTLGTVIVTIQYLQKIWNSQNLQLYSGVMDQLKYNTFMKSADFIIPSMQSLFTVAYIKYAN